MGYVKWERLIKSTVCHVKKKKKEVIDDMGDKGE